jgi:hypothetical protein
MAGTVQIVNKIKVRDFQEVVPSDFANIVVGQTTQNDMNTKPMSGNAFVYLVGGTPVNPTDPNEIKDRKLELKSFMDYIWRHGIVGDEMLSKNGGDIKVRNTLSGGLWSGGATPSWTENWKIDRDGAATFASVVVSGTLRVDTINRLFEINFTEGGRLWKTDSNAAAPIALDTTLRLDSGFRLGLNGVLVGTGTGSNVRVATANDIPNLSGLYLPLTGGTITGDITVSGAGTFRNLEAGDHFHVIPSTSSIHARITSERYVDTWVSQHGAGAIKTNWSLFDEAPTIIARRSAEILIPENTSSYGLFIFRRESLGSNNFARRRIAEYADTGLKLYTDNGHDVTASITRDGAATFQTLTVGSHPASVFSLINDNCNIIVRDNTGSYERYIRMFAAASNRGGHFVLGVTGGASIGLDMGNLSFLVNGSNGMTINDLGVSIDRLTVSGAGTFASLTTSAIELTSGRIYTAGNELSFRIATSSARLDILSGQTIMRGPDSNRFINLSSSAIFISNNSDIELSTANGSPSSFIRFSGLSPNGTSRSFRLNIPNTGLCTFVEG